MTKALGFLAGVCLTVTTFALVLDRWQDPGPEEEAPAPEIAEQADIVATVNNTDPIDVVEADTRVSTAVAHSDVEEPAAEGIPEEVTEKTPAVIADEAANTDASDKVETATPDSDTQPDPEAQMPVDALQPGKLLATDDTDPGQTAGTFTPEQNNAQTHLFWSPFRSKWAAEGFARRLTNSTQIPIEVISAGKGNFRVAFNYRDESERSAHIERIETITGLQLE